MTGVQTCALPILSIIEEGKVFGQRSRYRREMAQIFYKLFNYGQGSACNMEGLEIQENEQNLAYCHGI